MKGSLLALSLQLLTPVGLLAAAASAAELPTDGPRSAFAHRRAVELAPDPTLGDHPGFAALPLPPELAGSGEPAYADLRLLRSDGREVPYLLEIQSERHELQVDYGQLIDARSDSDRSVWLVDLLSPKSFDTLELQIADSYFAKRVTVEGASDRSGPFHTLRASAGVFDRPWFPSSTWKVRHTSIDWEVLQTARYLRLTVDDTRSLPIELRAVQAIRHRATPPQMWTRQAPLVELGAPPRAGRHAPPNTKTRYRLDLPPGLPVEQLLVRAQELALVRPARLLELRPGPASSDATDERELTTDTLYRLAATTAPPPPGRTKKHAAAVIDDRHIDAQLQAEWMTLRLPQASSGGPLILEIDNGDSPPLSGLQVEVYGCGARLIFEYPAATTAAAERTWALYYGNKTARPPHYDLEELRERLTQLGPLRAASLGAEQPNPRYQVAPPLSFVPTVGAPLVSDPFRLQRALRVQGSPDIYAVTLSPVDLGFLRPDLGDVRIVDAQDRQVPYVMSADAGEARAELVRVKDAAPRPRLSRYRLAFFADGDPQPLALPLLAVELSIHDTFYHRDVRLLQSPSQGEPGAPRLLYAGTLQRQDAEAAGLHSLPLSGDRVRELILEIDDQDNAPLTIERSSGVVRAPRLAFKLTPGEGYRLLLGNPEASPPQYDIETLRQAVLSYAALPAQLDRLLPNHAYRVRNSDYLLHAPPNALLWGSLLLAVAVLLLITVRLLGKTPPPPE